jgi:hypothetical protein
MIRIPRKWLYLVGLIIAASTAYGITVNGQLIRAAFENLSSAPTGTTGRVYFDTTLNSPQVYNGTSWTGLGGGGSGAKNYVSSGTSSATGWTASGSGVTVATDTTTGDLPEPTVGTALKVTGVSGSTAFAYADFLLDPSDYNKLLSFQANQKPSSGYVNNNFQVSVWSCGVAWSSGTCSGTGSGAATRLPLSTDSSAVTGLPNLTGSYRTTFGSTNATAPYIQVQIGLNASATPYMAFSSITVGPGVVTQGAVTGPWTAFTPIASWSAGTPVITGKWRQVGDSIELIDTFQQTASGTQSGSLTMSIPSQFTINTTTINSGTGAIALGTWSLFNSGVAYYGGVASYNSSTTINGIVAGTAGGITPTSPITMAINDAVQFHVVVPVNELVGSGTVNVVQNDLSYYYGTGGTWGTSSTVTIAQGPGGVLGGTTTPSGTYFYYTIAPTTPIPVGAKPVLEISNDQKHWFPVGNQFNGANFTSAPGIMIEQMRFDGTNYIGASVANDNSGNLIVSFGKYSAGTSSAWTGTWYWRVTVGLPGQAVGFGNYNPGVSSGLVPAAGLPGITTGTASAAGNAGYVTGCSLATGSATSLSTGTSKNICSFTLPAGNWALYGGFGFNGTVATVSTVAFGVSSSAGAGTGALPGPSTDVNPDLNGQTRMDIQFTQGSATTSTTTYTFMPSTVTISSPVTMFLVANVGFTGTGVTGFGSIKAIQQP